MIPFFQGAAGGAPVVSQVFAASTWTGNGGVQTVTTGVDLSTLGGLAWLKCRDFGNNGGILAYHVLYDTLRTGSPLPALSSDLTDAESVFNDNATTGELASFGTTGLNINRSRNATNYVGWSFARAARFFDVVTWTGNGTAGRQIPHNLGVAPGLIIVKSRSDPETWRVYHRSLGNANTLILQATDAADTLNPSFNSTDPTASVFTLGSGNQVNGTGKTYVAYLFAHDTASDGIVQCGSYTGNGSATGPTVTLGWRPQFLMAKRSAGGTGDWYLFDNQRSPSNTRNDLLRANTSDAESVDSGISVDFNLTGFQITSSNANINASGNDYVYLAIREAA